MAEPFLSEIRMMSFGYAPKGWAMCNGQFLPINQNQALFSLLGTTFGGDGRVTFALPDLRGQTPIHVGSGHTLGEKGGAQAVTLSISQMPTHVHMASGVNLTAATADPSNALLSQPSQALGTVYLSPPTALGGMNPQSLRNTGGSQAHLNMQPFLTLNICIALQGIFPSPN
jgi:microcystin-dependent protein